MRVFVALDGRWCYYHRRWFVVQEVLWEHVNLSAANHAIIIGYRLWSVCNVHWGYVSISVGELLSLSYIGSERFSLSIERSELTEEQICHCHRLWPVRHSQCPIKGLISCNGTGQHHRAQLSRMSQVWEMIILSMDTNTTIGYSAQSPLKNFRYLNGGSMRLQFMASFEKPVTSFERQGIDFIGKIQRDNEILEVQNLIT